MKLLLATLLLMYSLSELYSISPEVALQKLKDGNARFVSGQSLHPNINQERLKYTASEGQTPFATILACSDSRSPVEILFDQGVGDLFVIKVAGNVADVDEIATIEYGTNHLFTPILVVLGHSKCGAVTAVATNAELHGHLPKLVDNIQPALEKAKNENPDKHDKDLVDATIKANTYQAISDILTKSPIVSKLVLEGKLKIVGAIYNIESGIVDWLGAHPDEMILAKSAKDEHHTTEVHNESFFTSTNFIFMGIFIFIVSLIATLIIILFIRNRRTDDLE